MAKVNLTLPNLGIDELSDSQVIRKIASYLYIQNEQLRYELTHIDEDNMSSKDGATYQGMTQAQVQKAIEEAAKKTQDIDLSSNTIIINLQRRLDNLGKLQAQDAANITRITTELGDKVSTNTYNAGLSGLRALISGNTSLITQLNTNFQTYLRDYNNLKSAYNGHKHQISIDSNGVISMGGPTANPTNPNISATAYFKQKVAEAKQEGAYSTYLSTTPATVSIMYVNPNTGVPSAIKSTTVSAGRSSGYISSVKSRSADAVGKTVYVEYYVDGVSYTSTMTVRDYSD